MERKGREGRGGEHREESEEREEREEPGAELRSTKGTCEMLAECADGDVPAMAVVYCGVL